MYLNENSEPVWRDGDPVTLDTAAHDFLIECGLTDDEADHAIALAVRDAADEVERLRDGMDALRRTYNGGASKAVHDSVVAERDASRTAHAALVAEMRALPTHRADWREDGWAVTGLVVRASAINTLLDRHALEEVT